MSSGWCWVHRGFLHLTEDHSTICKRKGCQWQNIMMTCQINHWALKMCQMLTKMYYTDGARPQPNKITDRTTLQYHKQYYFQNTLESFHNTCSMLHLTCTNLWKKKQLFCKGFFSGFLLDLLAAAKSKLSVLWKSSKLIIQYSDAPQLAETTGLTSYRQGWLWSPKPLSGHYTSLSLIRLTDPGKNLYRICLDMLVCKQGDFSQAR